MSLFSMFSNDLGVDLGTSNVLIYAEGKGLVRLAHFRLALCMQ